MVTLGPLHLLVSLPGMFFSQDSWLTPSPLLGLCLDATSAWPSVAFKVGT